MSHLQGWSAHVSQLVLPLDSPGFISPSLWTDVIHREVLNQCDHLDGVRAHLLLSGATEWADKHFYKVDRWNHQPAFNVQVSAD